MKSYSDKEVGTIGDAAHLGAMSGKIVVTTRLKRPNLMQVQVLGSVVKRPIHIAIWSSPLSNAKAQNRNLIDTWNNGEFKRRLTHTEVSETSDGGTDNVLWLMTDVFFGRSGLFDSPFFWSLRGKRLVDGRQCYVLSGDPHSKGLRTNAEVSIDARSWLVLEVYFGGDSDLRVWLTCHSVTNPKLSNKGFEISGF